MKSDPSRPLDNSRHEAFALNVARGMSATEAYRQAGYAPKDADVNGPILIGNHGNGIKERVEYIKAQAATSAVLSIAEKREFLAKVLRTAIGDVDEKSPLCQSFEIGKEGERKYKMPCKLKTIERDDALAPEVEVKAAEIVIRIGQ